MSELDRYNKELIQEMSKVRDEVVKLKKSKPRKGEKAAPLSEKLSELEYLYDNSCREMEVHVQLKIPKCVDMLCVCVGFESYQKGSLRTEYETDG